MDRKLQKNERRHMSPMVLGCIVAILVGGLVFSGRSFAQDKKDAAPKAPTLYQRIGGYDAISNVVDDFIDQLRNDHAFDRFGGGRSKDSSGRTIQLVKDFICWKTGGPCTYLGRDMATAHQGLKITQKEWEAANKMLLASLVKFKVQEKEQKEFMALVETLRDDIVEKPAKAEKPAGN